MEMNTSVSMMHSDKGCEKNVDYAVSLDSKSFEPCDTSLLTCLVRNKNLLFFLRITGIIWTDPTSSVYVNALQCVWSCSIRAGLGIMFFWGIGGSLVHNYDKMSFDTKICLVVYGVTLFLQALTLSLSLLVIDRRIKGPACSNDVLFANATLRPSYIVLVTTILQAVIPEVCYIADTSLDRFYALLIGQLSICFLIAASTFFLTADCEVACKLIDQLMELQRHEKLTFEQFTLVRDDIHRREKFAYWVNNALVLVTLLDVVAVVLFLFLDVLSYGAAYNFAFVISLFLKELPFLFVVFWNVAKVNEKSSLFMKETAIRRWTAAVTSTTTKSDASGAGTVVDRENERRDICISAQAFPIAYSLAGVRLKRRDLLWQLLVWCIAFIVGILKKLVEDNVAS